MKNASLWSLLRKVHHDEEGAITLETILIIGAIALPILIFLIKVGWPRIQKLFNQGMDDLEAGANQGKGNLGGGAGGGGTGSGTGFAPVTPMLATVLLLGLVLVATITDLYRHRIYNWTTYSGILAALGLSGLRSLLPAVTNLEESQLEFLAVVPLRESVIGLLVCGFLMLVCFVAFRIGGGDVKLVAMLGAFRAHTRD